MAKYLLRRILHGILSVIIVVAVVMVLIYSLIPREQIFAGDPNFIKVAANQKVVYKYSMWERYGYLDYVTYPEWLDAQVKSGEIPAEERDALAAINRKADKDKEEVAASVARFTEYYSSQGYEVVRLDAVMNGRKLATGGAQQLFAYRDKPLIDRLWHYFADFIHVDNIHAVEDYPGERGIQFTLHDPVYGGEKFAPAILGSGTEHRYLLYVDNQFPYIHQNLVTLKMGASYSVEQGIDVGVTMTRSQGPYVQSLVTFPTGLTELRADDLHSATWQSGSRELNQLYADRFTDDYTNTTLVRSGLSRMGYSFVIGIISTALSYLIGVPIAIWMAQKKDKLVDKIGSAYVVFITAIPSLAYIFIVKAIGASTSLPTTFDMEHPSWLLYVLPIISLSLRPIGSTMRWLRRYMVDQQNADYVKFARSGGLSEGEIFRNHILKNAAIPIVHGIPAAILFSLVGALITERVYVVPGVGGLLIKAINTYDNGVIVGVTLFYAVLSIVSVILGDVLMSLVDPRISFASKER